ncbi:MAG TPA: DUF2933 domain-containing protein [Aliidongia sp.]|nr:DUF2933 domain-containing protein [Aliidongia sp.]
MDDLTPSQTGTLSRAQARDSVAQLVLRLLGFRGNRTVVLIVAATLGMAGFFAAWAWFGAAAVLPLLYVLPCAAMMLFCMRGHGGSGAAPARPSDGGGSDPSANR